MSTGAVRPRWWTSTANGGAGTCLRSNHGIEQTAASDRDGCRIAAAAHPSVSRPGGTRVTKRNRRRLFMILASMIPSAAHADAGLLPLIVVWPAFLLALIPIILVETEIFRRRLVGVPYIKLLQAVAAGNTVSTILGFPLFIAGLFGGSLLGFWAESFWSHNGKLFLLVLAAGYLMPAYFVSVYSEAFVIRKMLKDTIETILPISRAANLWSYGVLIIIFIGFALTR